MTQTRRRPRRMTPYMTALNHVQNLDRHALSVSDPLLTPAWDFNASNLSVPAALSFTRASSGGYFNANGLFAVAGTDTPRFDYEPVSKTLRGLLIEETRTNLIRNSGDCTQGYWSPVNAMVTATQGTAPDGGNGLVKWQRTQTGAAFILQNISKATTAITYTASVFAKPGSGRYLALRLQGNYPARGDVTFDLQSGSISSAAVATGSFGAVNAAIQPVGNGLYRCYLTAVSDTANIVSFNASFNQNNQPLDGTDSAANTTGYLWGAQVEAASTASSYVATLGDLVTRAADLLSNPAGASWLNPTAGTLVSTVLANNTQTGSANVHGVSDGTTANRVNNLLNPDGTTLSTRCSVAGVASNPGDLAPALVAGQSNRIGLTFSAAGGVLTVPNGTLQRAVSRLPAAFGPTTLNRLSLGCDSTRSSGFLNGWLQRSRYYGHAVTPDQLRALTT